MIQTIALAQTSSSKNPKDNLEKAKNWMKKAKEQGAGLLVFPEYFMTQYPDFDYISKAESLEGSFVEQMRAYAKEYQLWLIFGINEQGTEGKSYNTLVVINDYGDIQGSYRKTHLFDAYTWKESNDTIPGEKLFQPMDTPMGRIGLGTCYDLRFSEVARYARLQGADIMIYPSAWVKGDGKLDQWRTLLQARSIEYQMYVFGCDHIGKTYMGYSYGFDPTGRCILEGHDTEELQIAQIDLDIIKKVRHDNPWIKNRRTDLYD